MASSGLEAYLAIIWILGFYPVHHPFRTVKKTITFKRLIIALWSLLLAIFPLISTIDWFLHYDILPVADKPILSSLIPWYASVLSHNTINVIIRVFSWFHTNRLNELIEQLRTFATGYDFRVRKWNQRYIMYLYCLAQVGIQFWWAVTMLLNKKPQLNAVPMKFIPQVYEIRILWSFLSNMCGTMSEVFAISFVVIFGSNLAQAYQELCIEVSELMACNAQMHNKMPKTVACSLGQNLLEQKLVVGTKLLEHKLVGGTNLLEQKFVNLKKSFKLYEEMAGLCVICSLWWSFVVIINLFSIITSIGFSNIDVINHGICSLVLLHLVASFGEYLRSSTEDGREIVSDALGRRNHRENDESMRSLEQLAKWILRWRWRLTAMNCCTIDNGILPAVAGSVMTYYIFIFQLMLSEK